MYGVRLSYDIGKFIEQRNYWLVSLIYLQLG